MIKNRSFMFGLGAGLIIGALLLQLMISAGAAPMSKDQLIKEAAKLNLTVADKAADKQVEEGQAAEQGKQGAAKDDPASALPSGTVQPSASPKASPPAAPKAASKPTAAATPAEPAAPSSPVSSAAVKPQVKASPVLPPSTPEPAAAGTIPVKIPNGITLTETADLLSEAGVVKDKEKFLQTAKDRKANTRIQYGSYSFTKGESINSVIDKLITVK
ncbi:hypothetical protein [Paenibacillus sp. HW567]|uniref:hypothetical protein n=1 Tax=Paenibacillus sp. HW567 TaxID=1034769 RepID=UPI00037ABA2E|nr:hypothetical protein [Paenibacillus sp. HW567]